MKTISIVVPCYNEEESTGNVIDQSFSFFVLFL